MTSALAAWRRVTVLHRCPVCGKPDWCGVTADGAVAHCMRVESNRPTRNGGWLHRLTNSPKACHSYIIPPRPALSQDWGHLAARFRAAVCQRRLSDLARTLGVTVHALDCLDIGWASAHDLRTAGTRYFSDTGAWAFPMTHPASDRICGFRLRPEHGKKFSFTGGKEGLFLPTNLHLDQAQLLITEGETDAAALLSVGCPAVIGRPSCSGGIGHVVDLVKQHQPREAIIMADADEPGQRGAASLASCLLLYCPVRLVTPPHGFKDVREWVKGGATFAAVQTVIDAAPVRRLGIKKGGNHVPHA